MDLTWPSAPGAPACFWPISQVLFDQIQKVWSVLNLLVMTISNLTLLLIFGQVESEIIEVKDTMGHF